MSTEESEELTPTSKEVAKLVIPKEEGEKLGTKKLVIIIIGYISLIFAFLALFFPLWNDYSLVPPNFISLWRINILGTVVYHWEVLWFYQIYMSFNMLYIIFSIFFLQLLIFIVIYLAKRVWNIVMHDWKKPIFGTPFFSFSVIILLIIVLASFVLPEFDVSGNPGYITVLYGPSWGLSFGWYSLLLAGIFEMIYSKLSTSIKEEKKEE